MQSAESKAHVLGNREHEPYTLHVRPVILPGIVEGHDLELLGCSAIAINIQP